MKTITLELSKRLAPYLENIETEYWYAEGWGIHIYKEKIQDRPDLIKTLTTEEAMDFILSNLSVEDSLQLWNNYFWLFLKWELVLDLENLPLLEKIEKTLNYLRQPSKKAHSFRDGMNWRWSLDH